MGDVLQFLTKSWSFFWSIWPKNFFVLICISAIAEAISVTLFRLGGNRGWLVFPAYILGFFVVAFYAEGQKYSTLSISYPVWLGVVALLISCSAFFIFKDKLSTRWVVGFLFTVLGVFLIQTSFPEN